MSVRCVQAAGTKLEADLTKYHLCFHVHRRPGAPQTCRNHHLVYSSSVNFRTQTQIRRELKDTPLRFCHLMNDLLRSPFLYTLWTYTSAWKFLDLSHKSVFVNCGSGLTSPLLRSPVLFCVAVDLPSVSLVTGCPADLPFLLAPPWGRGWKVGNHLIRLHNTY